MKKILLTKGKATVVDDEDYALYGRLKWRAGEPRKGTFYAIRGIRTENGRRVLYLHRAILAAKPGEIVDHINRNSLDNRRVNLRICSHAENVRNQSGATRNSKSGVRGVSWDKQSKKWHAQIKCNGKNTHLGRFDSIKAAALNYRRASKKLFGAYSAYGEPK